MSSRGKRTVFVFIVGGCLLMGWLMYSARKSSVLTSPEVGHRSAAIPAPIPQQPVVLPVVAAAGVAAANLETNNLPASSVVPGTATLSTEPSAQLHSSSSPAAVAKAASAPVSEAELRRVAPTAQMYAAHASLRAPEVADPDSKSNREILQTMVTKSLSVPPRAAQSSVGK